MTTAAKLEQYSHLPHQIMQQELYSGLKEYIKIVCSSNSKYLSVSPQQLPKAPTGH